MQLSEPGAEVFVPDGGELDLALARTSHLGIGAHPDDLEFMAAHGILECFGADAHFFTGVVVTNGAGSARAGAYGNFSDERLVAARRREQKKAAYVGEYSAQLLLNHLSSSVKDPAHPGVQADLVAILRATTPAVVYTHNLADKHDTHVAVALRVIEACRALEPSVRPERLIGCEGWRDLDWLSDEDKVVMAVDDREHLQNALLSVFDSQIAGGKRYDLATNGRRRAHATYTESHASDRHRGLILGMDMTALMHGGDSAAYVAGQTRRFAEDVLMRVRRLGG